VLWILHSTGNSTQHSLMVHMRKESRKDWIYFELIHCIVQQKVTQHCKSNTLQWKQNKQVSRQMSTPDGIYQSLVLSAKPECLHCTRSSSSSRSLL
jgi:hypothetical protein